MAYHAYLLAYLHSEFETGLPDAFAVFTAEEARTYTFHQRRRAKSTMSAEVADAFYTDAHRLRRLLDFRKERPQCGLLDFWQWDRQFNPAPFERAP